MTQAITYHGSAPDVGAVEAGAAGVPVDVGLAVSELHRALDNFVTQLHYTVAKTKGTHVYKALVALGGNWSGVGVYTAERG